MPRRSYKQYCALARCLDLVGERWTLLLVRELLTGPKRFTDLLTNLPGIGTNLLAERLKELEGAGVLRRETLPPPAASAVYELTDTGRELEPGIVRLARWGLKTLGRPRQEDHLRPGWSLLALLSTFREDAAAGLRGTCELRIGDEVFHARVEDRRIETRQGPVWDPDVVITAESRTFLEVASGQKTPEGAFARGTIRLDGEPRAVNRWAREIS